MPNTVRKKDHKTPGNEKYDLSGPESDLSRPESDFMSGSARHKVRLWLKYNYSLKVLEV